AEKGWAQAAKDISNAGILGTLAIMMENSGAGALVQVPAIPRPEGIAFPDWLVCFQSFSFILAVPPVHTEAVLALFRSRNITAEIVGTVTKEPLVVLHDQGEQQPLFDFRREKITGIRFEPSGSGGAATKHEK
ncbi:MAG: AIR synthase-related protein, partial [Desulfobacterota bacterium]|nr:AIR synthase-related protein [Thermodesulfobacteriota bacterium]